MDYQKGNSMGFELGINTGFAVNRYSEPEAWTEIVGNILGLKSVQFTADMLNPDLPELIKKDHVKRIRKNLEKYDARVDSVFTGAFTRVNHLAHPESAVRDHWIDWFKRLVDISVELGANSMGSHFGIFTHKDDRDPEVRKLRRRQNIEGWHRIGEYAEKKGLKYLTWEPMSITREQGETIEEAKILQDLVNQGAPIKFYTCLDVDHGDLASPNPDDTDPYAWLRELGSCSPLIHLKQSSKDKSGHHPFTSKFNENGRIEPLKVLDTLMSQGVEDAQLILELSFREREPVDSTVVEVLKESVDYWKSHLS